MTEIDLLCELLLKQPIFTPSDYNKDAIEVLKSLDYWYYAGQITQIECDDCGDVHNLNELPHNQYGFFCPDIGELCFVDIDNPHYNFARLKTDIIIQDIQKSLKVTRQYQTIINTQDIQSLGSFTIGMTEAFALVAYKFDTLNDKKSIEYFIEQEIIKKRFDKKIGFVFTLQNKGCVELKHNFFTIPMLSVANIKNKNMIIDYEAINQFLPDNHKIKLTQAVKGRPSYQENLKIIYQELKSNHSDITLKSIEKLYKKHFSGEKIPSRTVIERFIKSKTQ